MFHLDHMIAEGFHAIFMVSTGFGLIAPLTLPQHHGHRGHHRNEVADVIYVRKYLDRGSKQ